MCVRIQFCVDALHWSHLQNPAWWKKMSSMGLFYGALIHIMCALLYEWICAWRSVFACVLVCECMLVNWLEKACGEFRKCSCFHMETNSIMCSTSSLLWLETGLTWTLQFTGALGSKMCSSVETFWLPLAPSGITKLIPMALWGLMKQNDQSVQEKHIFIFHILVPHDFFTLSESYIVTPVSQFIIN